MAKIYIGVGHGGSDSGAVGNGLKEKDLNLAVAKACKAALVRSGVTVKISRETDKEIWLEQRIAECNKFAPDYALDIHHNAGGGDGIEVYHSINNAVDDKLAENIIDAVKAIGQNSRGLKTRVEGGADYFGFIREIKCPSILVECAFVDTDDVKIVNTAAKQKAMGEAIAKGVLKTLNIAYVAEGKPAAKPTTAKDTVYAVKSGDTLSEIAEKYGTDYMTLAKYNGISNPDIINVGQKIKIPAKTTAAAAKPKTYKAGDAITLNNAPLYVSSTAKNEINRKTGKYYIYDGEPINGRYRITNSPNNVNRKPAPLFVTGWVILK